MKRSPFYRPSLAATRGDRLPWQEEVRGWLDQADDWLTGLAAGTDSERAHDLVALTGKLERLAPDLLTQLDGRGTQPRLTAAVAAGGRELIDLALRVIDLDGWHEEMDAILQVAESPSADAAELVHWAAELLDELDDAELIWWAGRRAGLEPTGLRADLDQCVREVVRSESAFRHAGVFVQALARPILPDLADVDPDLAETTRKLVYLLDQLEEVEADLAPLPPWNLQEPPALVGRIEPAADDAPPGVIPAFIPAPPIAARPSAEEPAVPAFRWKQAGQRGEARLLVPQKAPPDGKLYLEFSGGSFGGLAVVLGGLRGTVDPEGFAAFDWEELRAVEPFLDLLLVGRHKWQRIP